MTIERALLLTILTLAGPADDAREAPRKTADDHAKLAAWCDARGHRARAEEQARAALRLDADHAVARRVLGFVRVDGRWARTRLPAGFVAALQGRVDADLRRLVSRDAQERDAAREALLETASLEDLPALAKEVERLHAAAARLFAGRKRGVVEVRATSSKLGASRDFSTSLGSGGPVRFTLPELRSVRIGTTVGAPLGGP